MRDCSDALLSLYTSCLDHPSPDARVACAQLLEVPAWESVGCFFGLGVAAILCTILTSGLRTVDATNL